ncbi:malto-oligosyltrehalose trehalohydrolase [Luteitalea sp. TBR-22]|uniref:malto-oligosyltrehalose trehalohydrolase n=1 Tax=Luteitalea sp. TBR-22 TaxID=2802971 RepID=UPI001AFA9546|nr:malto-oligosyltrehalose trehalohydrolase [Luteitalea sp. TBR-22]BCS31358.1 malto-oligosyltrehalose trehalohydrolase [Luteitalea sp. TBR-22]
MSVAWTPTFGTRLDARGATFRVCAPGAREVRLLREGHAAVPLARVVEDTFEVSVPGVRAGDRYRLQRDDDPAWPDPCTRWQPDGVHGPSMVIDPDAFAWTDEGWRGVPRHALVVYELHVGTFTEEGTFAAAMARLPDLVELGVTAIELMPVAAFPGTRNWGYDGAALFAPSERYGHPDDLRALVDRAHALGLAVLLDVVYNHLGPDGAYLAAWMPTVFTDRHTSPWGRGINLDGPGSAQVRRLLCDNALHWLLEYHLDGLRLDATHALTDASAEHLLTQLAREVEAHVTGREVHLIAEDERNLDTLLLPIAEGGHGMTGVWADDFHHTVRRHLAGDHEAWFSDFRGSTDEIAAAVADGWVFSGQHAVHYDGPRGTSPARVPIEASVICLQNHDQVGNRAHGDRLHHQIDMAAWLAAHVLLLTAPETPLLFMGQEWAASTPFLFFTDHGDGLGERVVEGRRHEFRRFSAFSAPEARERIPSPQAPGTWQASRLDWRERERSPHAEALAQTRALLAIRRAHLGMVRDRTRVRCVALNAQALWLTQPSALGGTLATYVDFSGRGTREIAVESVQAVTDDQRRGETPRPTLGGLGETPRPALLAGSMDATVRVDAGRLIIDGPNAPLGVVLHLAGGVA